VSKCYKWSGEAKSLKEPKGKVERGLTAIYPVPLIIKMTFSRAFLPDSPSTEKPQKGSLLFLSPSDGSFFRKFKLTLLAPKKNSFAHVFRIVLSPKTQHATRLPKSLIDLLSESVNQIVNHPGIFTGKADIFFLLLQTWHGKCL